MTDDLSSARAGECRDALWKDMNMRLLLLATVAAAAVMSLTDAASAKHRHHALYPSARVTVYGSGPGYHSAYDVFSAGTYVGSDPDPQTRAQMLMDYNRGVYGMGNR
jgi:hypothetical protein